MDIDSSQKVRLDQLHKRYREHNDPLSVEDVFTSSRVIETFKSRKAIVSSYNRDALFGLLPFTPIVYNVVCPGCFRNESFEQFKSLVTSGLVVPVLRAPYSAYSTELRDFFLAHDHISRLEFQFYRFHSALRLERTNEVHAAMHRLLNEIQTYAGKKGYEKKYLALVERIRANVHPFVDADLELLERTNRAFKEKNLEELENLGRLSDAVSECRSAQAFNAAMVIRRTELDGLPSQSMLEVDEARSASADLRAMIARGLGIRIPEDIAVERYVELVKDYQPRISDAISSIAPHDMATESVEELFGNISAINREIERIKGLRRYAVLEACVGFYKSNSFLLGGALLAASLGLAGSLLGCAAVASAVGTKLAKKKGLITDNQALGRVKRIAVRDVQPIANRLLKSYLGGSAPAINVLSLQRTIESVSEKK